MKKIILLILCIVSTSSLYTQASELIYKVDGNEYAISGFENDLPFYLKDGKKRQLPFNGEYELRGNIQELVDASFLPEDFALRRNKDRYNTIDMDPNYLVSFLSHNFLKKSKDPYFEYWEDKPNSNVLLLFGWNNGSSIKVKLASIDNLKELVKNQYHTPQLTITQEEFTGHPAIWLVNEDDASIIPTQKRKEGSKLYLNWLLKTNRLSEATELMKAKGKSLVFRNKKTNPLHIAALYRRNSLSGNDFPLLKYKSLENAHSRTPIKMAVAIGNLEILKKIQLKESDLKKADNAGNKPIHTSIRNGHDKISLWLIDTHEQVNTKTKSKPYYLTPILAAVEGQRLAVFNHLKELKAKRPKTLDEVARVQFVNACNNGLVEFIQFWIDRGSNLEDETLFNQSLNAAIQSGNPAAVKLILGYGKKLGFSNDKNKETYLHQAATFDNAESIPLLLEKGLDINAVTSNGKTPLYYAVKSGSLNSAIQLLELGADPDIGPENGLSPIWMATYVGNRDEINALIKAGASCSMDPELAEIMVEYATIHDIPEIIAIALNECLSPDYKLYDEFPGIYIAKYYRSPNVIKLLQEEGQTIENSDTPQFVSARSLDSRIKFTRKPAIPYPRHLERKYGEINVSMMAIIDKQGKIILPKFSRSLPNEMLILVRNTVSEWRTKIPLQNGIPVNVKIKLPIKIKADENENTVFDITALDVPPTPILQIQPNFPAALKRQHASATLHIKFIVDENGIVKKAFVLESTDSRFNEAALKSIRQWKFIPGIKDGKKVKTQVVQALNFSIN